MFTLVKVEAPLEDTKESSLALQQLCDESAFKGSVRVGFGEFKIYKLPFTPETLKDIDNGRVGREPYLVLNSRVPSAILPVTRDELPRLVLFAFAEPFFSL